MQFVKFIYLSQFELHIVEIPADANYKLVMISLQQKNHHNLLFNCSGFGYFYKQNSNLHDISLLSHYKFIGIIIQPFVTIHNITFLFHSAT